MSKDKKNSPLFQEDCTSHSFDMSRGGGRKGEGRGYEGGPKIKFKVTSSVERGLKYGVVPVYGKEVALVRKGKVVK